jgi:PERQ amino acid-rich with GYF domain-containing protein
VPNNQGTTNNHNTPPQNRNKASGPGIPPGTNRPQTRRREPSDAALSGNPFATGTPPIPRRRAGDEGGSPIRERGPFFGRWGSAPNAENDDQKDKDEGSGGTGAGGRNAGIFRRGSGAAWGGGTGGSALNSPMGSFGNNNFGGGAMGGFILQTDKSKSGGAGTKNNATSQPKVDEVDEHPEHENVRKAVADTIGEDDEGDRPQTSDTDPYGVGDDHHSTNDRNSPLPTSGLLEQQRIKSSPFAGIGISTSNNPRGSNTIGTPTKNRNDAFGTFGNREGLGGMGSLGMSGLHHQLQNLTFNQQGQVPLRRSREGSIGNALAGDNEPLSPAETNPFQSPPPEKVDDDGLNEHGESGGLGSVIAGLRRGESQSIGAPGSDRSGRSSTAGLGSVGGGLGGFGGLGGPSLWGTSGGGQTGTPGLGVSAAPGVFFGGGGLGDLSSTGVLGGPLLGGTLGGLGGGNHFGSASRSSRLGALFSDNPHPDDGSAGGFESDAFGDSRFGAFGSRRGFGGITESPMRERGDVHDLFGMPSNRSLSGLTDTARENPLFPRDRDDSLSGLQSHQQESPLGAGVQTPGAGAGSLRAPPGTVSQQAQHVMIMPDKLQWVYRDPSGVVQGPFSGLEMHEWYRAGFFTSDLAVKRQEDTEFEQLGALVRKIGNTREPFLVPLPGNTSAGMSNVSANWSGSWLNEMPGAQAVQTPGSVQPPFAGSFPTFGTTLTAEQQNALERRKQEEQYLMAKQREFLLQQQMMAKQAAAAQQLHHQSSTQSLHSQPSFGSLHSPSGFAPTPTATTSAIGPQNTFEPGALLRQAGAAAAGGGVDSLGVGGLQQPGGQFTSQVTQQTQQPQLSQDQTVLMQQQQQRFVEQQRQQLQKSYQSQQNQHAEKRALQQAQEQAQHVAAQVQQSQLDQPQPSFAQTEEERFDGQKSAIQEHEFEQLEREQVKITIPEGPKVTIPVVKTSPAPKAPQPAWGGAQPAVLPFPPPPGQEPGLVALSPSVDTPSTSIAPWAKEIETPVKTPSLKEIQELEAKQAAAREAAEAQARREMLTQQANNPPPPPAPGLPSTATWAQSPSTTPATGASAWNKPLAKANIPAMAPRKTLQQIQKEEEARKTKAAAAAAAAAQATVNPPPVTTAAGKRYADLASKAAAANQTTTNSAWTTVGPGGKSKGPITPTGPAMSTPTAPASVIKASAFSAPTVKKPVALTAPAKPATSSAQDEFMKWLRSSLKDLKPGYTSASPSLLSLLPLTVSA